MGLAAVALAVAVWAAWPREAPNQADAASEDTRATYPTPLDSTSEYYRPGLSEQGVYFDSSAGSYFRFEDE